MQDSKVKISGRKIGNSGQTEGNKQLIRAYGSGKVVHVVDAGHAKAPAAAIARALCGRPAGSDSRQLAFWRRRDPPAGRTSRESMVRLAAR